jgi:hypothetical protein
MYERLVAAGKPKKVAIVACMQSSSRMASRVSLCAMGHPQKLVHREFTDKFGICVAAQAHRNVAAET